MTGADGARVANLNLDVSEISVPRLTVNVSESRGEENHRWVSQEEVSH